MGEAITVEVPRVVPRTLFSRRQWWRWTHSDRTLWRQAVREALAGAGIAPRAEVWRLARVRVEWGTQRPWLSEEGRERLFDEALAAIASAGVGVTTDLEPAVAETQSGYGRGTTWLELERV